MEKRHLRSLISSSPWFDSRSRNQLQERMMNRKQEEQAAADAAVAEFLANGGTITQCVYGKSGRVEGESYNPWSKKKTTTSTSPLANPPEDDE
jgi:hypothetical protein